MFLTAVFKLFQAGIHAKLIGKELYAKGQTVKQYDRPCIWVQLFSGFPGLLLNLKYAPLTTM